MKKKIDIVREKPQEDLWNLDDSAWQKVYDAMDDHKWYFAKVSWNRGSDGMTRGPYILAFKNSIDFTACEMNAWDFKQLEVKDLKMSEVSIWEFGIKDSKYINKLPKLNVQQFLKGKKK